MLRQHLSKVQGSLSPSAVMLLEHLSKVHVTAGESHHLPVRDALLHAKLPGRTGSDSRVVQLVQTALPSPGTKNVLTGHGRQIKSPVGCKKKVR
jgi:hypothetical protein